MTSISSLPGIRRGVLDAAASCRVSEGIVDCDIYYFARNERGKGRESQPKKQDSHRWTASSRSGSLLSLQRMGDTNDTEAGRKTTMDVVTIMFHLLVLENLGQASGITSENESGARATAADGAVTALPRWVTMFMFTTLKASQSSYKILSSSKLRI